MHMQMYAYIAARCNLPAEGWRCPAYRQQCKALHALLLYTAPSHLSVAIAMVAVASFLTRLSTVVRLASNSIAAWGMQNTDVMGCLK